MSTARVAPTAAAAVVRRSSADGRGRRVDMFVLLCCTTLSFAACWLLRAPWWAANVTLLTLPATYLLVRSSWSRMAVKPWFVAKYALFVSVFFDYLCVRYGAWAGPTDFPVLPGGVLVEQVTWCALMIVIVVVVHERFFAQPSSAPTVRWPRTVLSCFFFAGFVVALAPPLQAPLSSYVYLKIGTILYPFIFVVALFVDRQMFGAIAKTGAVFLVFNLLFELLALHNGYWSFPGDYVGWVTVAGWRFPIEEFSFMVVLLSPAIAATNAVYLNWKGIRQI